jgi:hypothetical protein
MGAGGEQVLAMMGREALDGSTLSPYQGLGAEPGGAGVADGEAQGHLLSRPLVRNPTPEPEPRGVPGWSPGITDRKWLVLGGQRLGGGDRFAMDVEGGDIDGHRWTPAPGADEFIQDPIDPAHSNRVLGAHDDRV